MPKEKLFGRHNMAPVIANFTFCLSVSDNTNVTKIKLTKKIFKIS